MLWVRGYAGITGNERADELAGQAAAAGRAAGLQPSHSPTSDCGYLKSSEEPSCPGTLTPSTTANRKSHPYRPKKYCLDNAPNSIARAAAQNKTGQGHSPVYLKGVTERAD
jgi:hypothetical protein